MPERLLTIFENQAEHRMTLEEAVILGDVRRANWGLGLSFIFGVLVLLAAVLLILKGHDTVGTGMIIVEFIGYGSALVYTTMTRRNERREKMGQQQAE